MSFVDQQRGIFDVPDDPNVILNSHFAAQKSEESALCERLKSNTKILGFCALGMAASAAVGIESGGLGWIFVLVPVGIALLAFKGRQGLQQEIAKRKDHRSALREETTASYIRSLPNL